MNESKFLAKLYEAPKKFECVQGCTDCCGPVFTTKIEAERLGIEVGTLTNIPGTSKCQFATDSGCSVHDKRPMMCRIFGATEVEELKCPHGKGPFKKLSKSETTNLISKYKTFVILDAEKVTKQISNEAKA